jgi:hypothetical protein
MSENPTNGWEGYYLSLPDLHPGSLDDLRNICNSKGNGSTFLAFCPTHEVVCDERGCGATNRSHGSQDGKQEGKTRVTQKFRMPLSQWHTLLH